MKIGLFVNLAKPDARRFVAGLVTWLHEEGHEPLLSAGTARALRVRATTLSEPRLARAADLVVALGGDGTLLRAARAVGAAGTPVMGVNLGGLGFLTEFSTDEARAGIRRFCRGRHREEPRLVLEVRAGRRHGFCLNDCAVNMGASGRVIKVNARSGASFINRYVGDGVVVATPTGSTAYSLAAGGPVVHPALDAILLTPLCPHALAARPLILAPGTVLTLELVPDSDPALLNLDGQQRWRLAPGATVSVTRAPHALRLVTPRTRTWYRILRDKLKWSGGRV